MSRIRQLWILAVLAVPSEFSVQADQPAQFPEAVAHGDSAQDRATVTGGPTSELDAAKARRTTGWSSPPRCSNTHDRQTSHPASEALADARPGIGLAAVGGTENLSGSAGADRSEHQGRGSTSASGSDEFQRHERASGAGCEPIAAGGSAADFTRTTAGRRSVDQFAGRALWRHHQQPRSRDPAAGQRPGGLSRVRRGRSDIFQPLSTRLYGLTIDRSP